MIANLVLGFVVVLATASQGQPPVIPPMEAHWPLDDGKGTAVTEVVGGLNGTLNNADTEVAWTSGVLGGALHLDGIDDRVIVPHNPAFDFADEAFSVSFLMRWPKGGRSPRHEHLLTKGDYASSAPGETGKRWEIIFSSGGLNFNVDDDVNKSQIQVAADHILKGDWVHIVAVRDTKDKLLKLYIDGVLQPSTNPDKLACNGVDRTGSIANPRELFIGDASRRDNPFAGDMDDIRIYRTALSMHQVAALAKTLKPAMKEADKIASSSAPTNHRKTAAAPARAPRPFAVPSLVAHWPLNDETGTAVEEVVGGHNGELTNADMSSAWISGKCGGALRLDGVNDRIFVPHHLAFDFAEESFTVAFWMRWKQGVAPHSQHLLTKGDYHSAAPDQTGRRWEVFVSGGNRMCFTIDDDVVSSRVQVPLEPFVTGEWVHVAAIRDMAKKQLRLYANGVLLPPTNPENPAIDGVDRTGSIANPQRLTIGDAYLCDNPFAGDMDDIRIYLGTLTEPQIAALASLAVQTAPGAPALWPTADSSQRPRVIVTSDAEIDDECSFVRCLLYANDFDIEGIISTSSQYHAHDHRWAGDDWYVKYLDAYTEVYPNLVKHDRRYPTPDYLKAITFLGNVETEGDMKMATPGSDHIVKVLLDDTNDRPIWLQAWGGMNTIARALKTIEEEHPERMAEVAKKIRFYFIWEQDNTYQSYIRPHWAKYDIPTIISDQFIAIAYDNQRRAVPQEMKRYYSAEWMNQNLLRNHGPLLALYKAHDDGRFRSEGDSPAFLHTIVTGLRNLESPDWGGWGGRYVKVRENTWLDPVQEPGYEYPEGRWYTSTAWGRSRMRKNIPNDQELAAYLKPMWRWIDALQHDFAARADWCVKSYNQANHPPVVKLTQALDLTVRPGQQVSLSAKGTTDPDGDALTYRWWQYQEADTYAGAVTIENVDRQGAAFAVPEDAGDGQTIHVICEVTDAGTPPLTRYQRVVMMVER